MRDLFMFGRLRFLVPAFALALALALMTACGPLPRPFKPPEPSSNPLVTEVALSGIWIQTIDGISL
ncbi:MAG: hypothetical protein V3U44_09655, partial [Alphaproteobacteria bacterium]